MIHAFSDTDIILDVITGRMPHGVEASSFFTLVEEEKIRASTSALSFSNIYYVLRNIKDYKKSELPIMTPGTFLKTYLHTS